MDKKKFDLDERLIDFAVEIVLFVESLPNTKSSTHLGSASSIRNLSIAELW
jgi:hypothetical protein